MKVLGIYGSPRQGGNSDLLLDKVLEGAGSAGAEIQKIYVREMKISGCQECGGCDKTGECVIPDEMHKIYPKLMRLRNTVFIFSDFFLWTAFPGQGPGGPLPGHVVEKGLGEISGAEEKI